MKVITTAEIARPSNKTTDGQMVGHGRITKAARQEKMQAKDGMQARAIGTQLGKQSSDGGRGKHNVENIMLCSFAHHACSPLFTSVLTRRRLVSCGSDTALCIGCGLSLSRLNAGTNCVSIHKFESEGDSVAFA